jgi:hypothetical protein
MTDADDCIGYSAGSIDCCCCCGSRSRSAEDAEPACEAPVDSGGSGADEEVDELAISFPSKIYVILVLNSHAK